MFRGSRGFSPGCGPAERAAVVDHLLQYRIQRLELCLQSFQPFQQGRRFGSFFQRNCRLDSGERFRNAGWLTGGFMGDACTIHTCSRYFSCTDRRLASNKV